MWWHEEEEVLEKGGRGGGGVPGGCGPGHHLRLVLVIIQRKAHLNKTGTHVAQWDMITHSKYKLTSATCIKAYYTSHDGLNFA